MKYGERSAVDVNFELTEAGQGIIYLRLEFIAGMTFILRRRIDKLTILNNTKKDDDDDDSIYNRPSSLLEHINAATRSTILGASSPFGSGGERYDADPFGADGSNFVRAETPSDAGTGDGVAAYEETSRPAHARYSFDGAGEGELALKAGLEVEILDDRDPAYVFIFFNLRFQPTHHLVAAGGMQGMRDLAERESFRRRTCIRFLLFSSRLASQPIVGTSWVQEITTSINNGLFHTIQRYSRVPRVWWRVVRINEALRGCGRIAESRCMRHYH